ncbi:MAG: phosphatidylglycerol lysyltransferase [Treponema sp.]|jgi:phosphoglucomutase|nr:phosphatidylglycerol lysyltransferase [Treponema sp.]
MIIKDDINTVIKKMILSASGWRGVFSKDDDEESTMEEISEEHRIICACAAYVFLEYLMEIRDQRSENTEYKPVVLLGRDTRPTGNAIIKAMIPVLLNSGCDIKYAGVVSAPEIMAWARNHDSGNIAGFIYVSASHNPVGHNGLKFGLTDGGVLQAEETNKLIKNFNIFINNGNNIKRIMELFSQGYKGTDEFKKESKDEAINTYYSFCNEVVWGNNSSITEAVKKHLAKKPLGIVCDFNGSARTVSIDRKYFNDLGLKFECINAEPGQIAHRIVPEGESLDPCCKLLKEAHYRDESFTLGYVPDCDGDRGNLVIFDSISGKTRALEAQEVFALACVAELSHLVWTGELSYDKDGKALCKAAIAVNDPTSMRIDKIAGYFGVSVFRAEVGEANVVSLARKLRENGCLVRILGEGSAGGNITHPSAVRDPLNTVLAIVKMLTVRSTPGKPGFFEIWCKLSGQIEKHYDDFTLSDIISSLPEFTTTPVYNKDAVMRINTHDHALLKDRYQKIFLRERDARKDEFKTRFGFCGWEAASYNGTVEKRALSRFGEAARGGLKIRFFSAEGREIAYIWMRGSATEPVFRIMADIEGSDTAAEKFLLDWQRNMIMEADNIG